MKNKRTICLVTNWYPTKENPFFGSFFKEQAFAMAEQFRFVVVHYWENPTVPDPVYWLRRLGNKHFSVEKVNEEQNTVEYTIHAQIPLLLTLLRKADVFLKQLRQKPSTESKLYAKHRQKLLDQIFGAAFPETFDLLYGVSAQTESSLLMKLSRATGKPYVLAEHAPFPWPGTVIREFEKEGLRNADAFLAISYDKIRQVLLQDIQLKRIAYVGNMVDEDRFLPSTGSGHEKTFLMVAAHSFYKHYDLFIQVFNRLTQITDAPFKVMVVGYNANKGYSKNADVLEQKLRNSLFASHLELIPAVSREDIPQVYARTDAFVMTSIQEGMPVSALEAACCGLPIFSTMCGGVEDYVDDTMGRIFKIVDSESFAQSLKAYLEGNITFDNAHIRQQIIDRFGKKAFTENLANVFNEIIDLHQEADECFF